MNPLADSSGVSNRRTPKAAQVVADVLRRRIVTGELSAGDPLPNETALMEVFEVSRPTLREALRILESERLIEVRRGANGGARVLALDAAIATRAASLLLQLRSTTMTDVFQARRTLEPAAVRILAERPTKAAVKALRVQHARELAATASAEDYAGEATRFHVLLAQLSGNKTLALFSEMLADIVGRHHRATMVRAAAQRGEFAAVGSDHHLHLIALVEERRAEEAEVFWRFHIDGATDRALKYLGPRSIVDLLD